MRLFIIEVEVNFEISVAFKAKVSMSWVKIKIKNLLKMVSGIEKLTETRK